MGKRQVALTWNGDLASSITSAIRLRPSRQGLWWCLPQFGSAKWHSTRAQALTNPSTQSG